MNAWLDYVVAAWGEPSVKPPVVDWPTAKSNPVEFQGVLWHRLGRGSDAFLRRAWVWFPRNQNHGLHIDFRGSRPGEVNTFSVAIWGDNGGGPYVRCEWQGLQLGAVDTAIKSALPLVFGVDL